jgi:transcriptional regulator with XRE-family HTH domain
MMPERNMDPSVDRRRLRNILRQTRESLGIIQATAADAMAWSVSKLIRIETGTVTISANDLKALLDYYGINDPEKVTNLVNMAKNSKRNSWTSPYKGIASDVFLTYIGHEDAAVRSYSFQPILVPGLLQTDEYALEVLKVMRGSKDRERIDGLVELRITRQERVFARIDEIQLNYLIDESVVRRVVGGAEVMKRQVRHLINQCQREKLSIRVVPFKTGVYRSMRVPFVVLEFSDPEEEAVLYLEHPQRESLIREDRPFEDVDSGPPTSPPTTPPTYLEIFAELQQKTSDEETLRILQSALAELESYGPADSEPGSADSEPPTEPEPDLLAD